MDRIFSVDARPWREDDYIGDSDLSDTDSGGPWGPAIPGVLMPQLLCYGDYDNSGSVERSNYRVFLEQYGGVPGVHVYSGGYGGRGILLAPWALAWIEPGTQTEWAGEHRCIREALANLDDYAVLDEDDLMNFEIDSDEESYTESYGIRHDYIRALTAIYPDFDPDVENEDARQLVDEAFERARERANVYWVFEGGRSWIDVDRIVAATSPSSLLPLLAGFAGRVAS